MKNCPRCYAELVGDKFCQACGYDLQKHEEGSMPSPTDGWTLPNYGDFSFETPARQPEADNLAELLEVFETEAHQNGKYAIRTLKNRLATQIIVPEGVETIGPGAFEGCGAVSVKLPEGLVKIGDRAFADCVDLEFINIPGSLRVMGNEVFAGCTNLAVRIPGSVRTGADVLKGTATEQTMLEEAQRQKAQQEAAQKQSQLAREQAAQQQAQEEADRLDADITRLEHAARTPDWCKEVEQVTAMAKGLSDRARPLSNKLHLLEKFKGEFTYIQKAAETDAQIRALAAAADRGEAWCRQVADLDKTVSKVLRRYLVEKENLALLVKDAEQQKADLAAQAAQQKAKEEAASKAKKLNEKLAAQQKAQEEADKLDAAITDLEQTARSLVWCKEAERVAAMAETLSDRARLLSQKLPVLEKLKGEIAYITKAAETDKAVRQLAFSDQQDGKWCSKVLNLEKKTSKVLRQYMAEADNLTLLAEDARRIKAELEADAAEQKAREEAAKKQQQLEREQAAEQKAREDAALLDARIAKLENAQRDGDWFEDVDRVASMAGNLSKRACELSESVHLLKKLQSESADRKTALQLEETVCRLAEAANRDEAWCRQVLDADRKITAKVKPYLKNADAISPLLPEAREKLAEFKKQAETEKKNLEMQEQREKEAAAKNEFQTLLQRAKSGDTKSQIAVAQCYTDGTGVEKNAEEAVKWYQKAAKLENTTAMLALAQCYEMGIGVKRDPVKALDLYAEVKKKEDYKSYSDARIQAGRGMDRLFAEARDIENAKHRRIKLLKAMTAAVAVLFAILAIPCIFPGSRGFAITAVVFSAAAIAAATYWLMEVDTSNNHKAVICALVIAIVCGLVGCWQWFFVYGTRDFVIKDGVLTKSYANAETVEVPDGVKTVKQYAFGFSNTPRKCEFECVILPDSVTHIERLAFWDCHALREIHLGANIVYIGDRVFSGCSNFTVYFHGTQEQWDAIEKEDWDIGAVNCEVVFVQ